MRARVLLAFALIAGVSLAASCGKTQEPDPLQLQGSRLTINNRTKDDWKDVQVVINRQYRIAARLVVKGHIARHDRVVERQARLSHPLDRSDEFTHDLGPFGVAEIHVVGQRQRFGADRGQVSPALGDGLRAASHRVGVAVARRAVGR